MGRSVLRPFLWASDLRSSAAYRSCWARNIPFTRQARAAIGISDRLPHIEKHIDDLCVIKSMRTDQFNHAPAQLLVHTGNAPPRLSLHRIVGDLWIGTENQNLPGFIVLVSGGNQPDGGKQLWGSGFLPSVYQGVQCRSHGEPVLYLENPADVSRPMRRRMLDAVDEINKQTYEEYGNPETVTRIAQYEMAFRMQMDATDVMNIRKESDATLAAYGAKPGESSFANNCVVARRLAERGVRFIQLLSLGDGMITEPTPRIRSPWALRTAAARRSTHRRAPYRSKAAAACSRTRWLFGAASSAAPPCARIVTVR